MNFQQAAGTEKKKYQGYYYDIKKEPAQGLCKENHKENNEEMKKNTKS